MRYPSSIFFSDKTNGISVSYGKSKFTKYNLDIWAISRLLNEKKFSKSHLNTIELDLMDITMALRVYFLPKIIRGIKIVPNVESRVASVIQGIKNGKYITYPKNHKFSQRNVKKTKESQLEADICNNMSGYFKSEFSNNIDEQYGKKQFPANIFEKEVKERNRISRKFWIDALTVNKKNQLSVIELKAGSNAPLDLFIQAIDYGIYCYLLRAQISKYPFISNQKIKKNKVAVYLIAEKFHPALVGNQEYQGLVPFIKQNDALDVIFIKIKEEKNKIKDIPEVIFDTRKL